MRGVYAYICTACNHCSSEHRWDSTASGSLVDGPYVCLHCDCSIPQEHPCVALTEREFRQWEQTGELPTNNGRPEVGR